MESVLFFDLAFEFGCDPSVVAWLGYCFVVFDCALDGCLDVVEDGGCGSMGGSVVGLSGDSGFDVGEYFGFVSIVAGS